MKLVGRLLSASLIALSASCSLDRTSTPGSQPLLNRSTAPGLDQACRDQNGQHLARRPNAPLDLLCALTLPASSGRIQNGTKFWVEGGKFYLTEVGNASVYVYDAVSHDFVAQVTGFVGQTGNAATSGPNSITFSEDGHAWVSDGISVVRVVDLASMTIVATISTAIPACDNGTIHNCQRTNEISYDPDHHIIFVQNPSPLGTGGAAIDTYGTFISSVAPYNVLGTITFANRRGQEAPLWDPDQHRFLTAVSGRQVGTTVFHQYVAVIDPTVTPFTVEHEYDIDCTALGLTGAGGVRLFGINDPSLAPGGHMVIPGCGRALLMDALSGAVNAVMPVGGGNETWYNPGDGNFYVTGADFRTPTPGPNSLGVIDAGSGTMKQFITAVGATNPTAAAENNNVFAVVPSNANPTACTPFGFQASGCILVFAHVPDGGSN